MSIRPDWEREPLTFAFRMDDLLAARAGDILARAPRVEVVPLSASARVISGWIPVFSTRGPTPAKNAFCRLLDLRLEADLQLLATQGLWLAPASMHAAVWPLGSKEDVWTASIRSLPEFTRRIQRLRAA